jgi:hypothetical protein
MKEEVGMKGRRPSGALVALAAAGAVMLTASMAAAVSPNSPYTNQSGVTPGVGGGVTGGPARRAGMALNPGHVGQWLWGTYYDVRPVTNGSTGAADAQDVNIQILNTNPNNPAWDDYNPFGGLIARVRFRESKTSREVLDFDIIVSCAEVWTAKVELPAGATLPRIVSEDPIRIATTAVTFTTGPALLGGKNFVIPTGLVAADVQRGYFEVVAEEALPCEPIDGQVDRTGDVWSRLVGDRTPTDALAGEVILIRVAAGVSHFYNLEAVTRYRIAGSGSAFFPTAGAGGSPLVNDCVGPDNIDGVSTYTGTNCVNQMNFLLSKSRVMAQYDIQNITGGSTRVIFTLPTKHSFCALNGSSTDFNNVPVPPFACQGITGPQGGEQIGCLPYNRIEDFPASEDIFSPGDTAICRLPRELTIVNIKALDSPTSLGVDAVSDIQIDTDSIPREHLAGWVDFDLFRDPQIASQLHQQFGLNPDRIDLLGVGYSRYRGLPVLSLVLQEYLNASLAPSGVYGGTLPPPYEVYYAVGS